MPPVKYNPNNQSPKKQDKDIFNLPKFNLANWWQGVVQGLKKVNAVQYKPIYNPGMVNAYNQANAARDRYAYRYQQMLRRRNQYVGVQTNQLPAAAPAAYAGYFGQAAPTQYSTVVPGTNYNPTIGGPNAFNDEEQIRQEKMINRLMDVYERTLQTVPPLQSAGYTGGGGGYGAGNYYVPRYGGGRGSSYVPQGTLRTPNVPRWLEQMATWRGLR